MSAGSEQQFSVRNRDKRSLHAEIEKERETLESARHAPRWMIHPSNRYKKLWDILVFTVVVYMAYALPWSLGFTNPVSDLILQPTTDQRIALSEACLQETGYTTLSPELIPVKYAILLPTTPEVLDNLDTFIAVLFFVDMLLSFRTGYLPPGSGVIEFGEGKVAKKYLKVAGDPHVSLTPASSHIIACILSVLDIIIPIMFVIMVARSQVS